MKVLILGADGFIGSHLVEKILKETDWQVTAFDLNKKNLKKVKHPNFTFKKGDIFKADKWLDKQVAACDAVLPLVGVAKPMYYIKKPVWTFELDFEQNLKVVKMCLKHKKRVIFPSTSEVYGMSPDKILDEQTSPLMLGPINKMRWIYSCSKQMMDRVITAYAQEYGLRYTLFRPFNWVGARLDTFEDAKARAARSITQMFYDVIKGRPVILVNGGRQRRSFTYIGDALEALLLIIANDNDKTNGQIFNIGNPDNNHSVKELAAAIVEVMGEFKDYKPYADKAQITAQSAAEYYGKTYEDAADRRPNIANIFDKLGWAPKTTLRQMIRLTLEDYLS
ncbi:MAG: bifunctional UDP-4-keto-pentose/UDP-xylose synthase, partial [Elusimicrobiota bacterium]|nr:bifunctional UDP-4-keto-pentose/UDP-xylose synthase [Elusimicrobiota bacterium]